MKVKISVCVLISCAVLVLGFLLAFQPQTALAKDKFRLTFQATWPSGLTLYDNFKYFCKRVDQISGGRLKIKHQPAGAIVPAFELLDATSKGVVDGAHAWAAYWVGKDKTAGFDVNPSFKWRYMIYMRQNGITVYNDCDVVEVTDDGIVVKTYDGYQWPIQCDSIVLSQRESNESLKKAVQSEGIELFVIGDALIPRNLSSAVHDGYRIGIRI